MMGTVAPRTPIRTLRASDETWGRIKEAADKAGKTVTAYVLDATLAQVENDERRYDQHDRTAGEAP